MQDLAEVERVEVVVLTLGFRMRMCPWRKGYEKCAVKAWKSTACMATANNLDLVRPRLITLLLSLLDILREPLQSFEQTFSSGCTAG